MRLSLNLASVDLFSDPSRERFYTTQSTERIDDGEIDKRIGIPTREAIAALQIDGVSIERADERMGKIRVSCRDDCYAVLSRAISALHNRKALNGERMWFVSQI
jgi:hypothetical protein